MRDVVRVFRMTRPWVVISRFQGNTRDGHGNHQAAGFLSQQAAEAAGRPDEVPGADRRRPAAVGAAEGRTWAACRQTENWTIRVDSGEYSPWLGDSYANIAAYRPELSAVADQRPLQPAAGARLRLLHAHGVARDRAGEGELVLRRHRHDLRRAVQDARAARRRRASRRRSRRSTAPWRARCRPSRMTDPARAVPALADGAAADARGASRRAPSEPDVLFVLRIKERQFQDAISAALGLELTAFADTRRPRRLPRAGAAAAARRGAAPTMTAPVPGQTFGVGCAARQPRRRADPVGRSGIALQRRPARTAHSRAPRSRMRP